MNPRTYKPYAGSPAMTYWGAQFPSGARMFTAWINDYLCTYRSMGYTKRHATQLARAYFKREQEAV